MLRHKRLVFLLFVLLVVMTATTMTVLRGQEQNKSSREGQQPQDENRWPIVEATAPEPATPELRAERQVKGRKYDKDVPTIGPEMVQTSIGYHWPSEFPALPVSQSDALVTGVVTEAQAYLSSDKTNVYSEFTVKVEQVLKSDGQPSLATDKSIVMEREGGRVRYPSGKISRVFVDGLGMPRVGQRYLFFLTRKGQEKDFSILTGYEMRAGHVYPLDDTNVVNFQSYANADEKSFLEEVHKALATH